MLGKAMHFGSLTFLLKLEVPFGFILAILAGL